MLKSIALVLILIFPAFGQDRDSATPSVCELFKDLQKHVDTTVTVRGTLYRGMHGTVLVGHNCTQKFATKGYVWPTSLAVSFADEQEPSIAAVSKQLDLLANQYGRYEGFQITLTAILKLRNDYSSDHKGGPVLGFTGFGPFGSLPGLLVVKSIADLDPNPFRMSSTSK